MLEGKVRRVERHEQILFVALVIRGTEILIRVKLLLLLGHLDLSRTHVERVQECVSFLRDKVLRVMSEVCLVRRIDQHCGEEESLRQRVLFLRVAVHALQILELGDVIHFLSELT